MNGYTKTKSKTQSKTKTMAKIGEELHTGCRLAWPIPKYFHIHKNNRTFDRVNKKTITKTDVKKKVRGTGRVMVVVRGLGSGLASG
jgi:hypothetical protein